MSLRTPRAVLAATLPLVLACALAGCPRRPGAPVALDQASRLKVEEARRQTEAGRRDEAKKLLAQVPQVENPELAEALFALGESQRAAGDFAGARDSYRQLLAAYPLYERSDLAKYRLAIVQLELKEFRDALQTLTTVEPRLPVAERPFAVASLARAARGARDFAAALRWEAEEMRLARDERGQKEAYDRIVELVESELGFTDVARLAQETPPDSALWPLVQFKLARIFAHLRDAQRMREALDLLLLKVPGSPFAAEARRMLERAERRAVAKSDTVGLAVPLSGKYKSFGEGVVAGVQLALGGSRLKIVTRDTAGDPARARTAVSELAQDEQVLAIVGPVLSAESEDAAVEAELQETPIVTLTPAEGITDKGAWVFRNMLTNGAQAKALADYAMRVKGLKTFAVLYPSIPYGQELMNLFWDQVDEREGQMRGAEVYEHDQTTFAPVVKRLVGRYFLDEREEYKARTKEIKETVKDPFRQRKMLEDARKKLEPVIDFEALFIPDYYRNVGLIAPALAVEDVITNACDKRDLERIAKTTGREPKDVKTVQLLGGNGWNFQELVQRGGKFVQCAVFVDGFFAGSDRKETRLFVDKFRTAYNREPTLLEAVGFDTARILRQIVDKEQPTTRAAMREGLLRVKDFPGATGRTTISPRREAEKQLFLLTIDRDEIREVDSEVKG